MNKKSSVCPKSGIKIQESIDPISFFNKLKQENKHTGVRIVHGENEYDTDPFSGINPFTCNEETTFHSKSYDPSAYENIDLRIENYSREDIFTLFGLDHTSLTEGIMKECKKTVLKTHPDKSQLDPKYFLFFSSAYKKLYSMYQFQNKHLIRKTDTTEYQDKSNHGLLDHLFEKNKPLQNTKEFNTWFNEQFEKHKLEDPMESGYGDWLKSDEDLVTTNNNVTKATFSAEMEKHKKQVQQMVSYKGVSDNTTSSSFGGSSLMEYHDHFSSGSLFSNEGMNYTDLKQAYNESVIPVTEEDYHKVKKFQSIDEYKRHRENASIVPLSKEEAMRKLYQENKQKDEESAALAFYYAVQEEKAKKKQDDFWSGLKQLK
jgi:hypothetical protein